MDLCEQKAIHAPDAVKRLAEELSEQPVLTREKHLELIELKNKKLNELAADNSAMLELCEQQSKFFHGMDETLLNLAGQNEELRSKIPTYKTPNLVRAINQVTKEVRNIEKNTQVGEGKFAFNAVSDKDVKFQIGQAMERAGLAIIPTGIEPTTTVKSWEETFNGRTKQKQQVFTEVQTTYALIHESGERIEVAGYGHGVDSMDKSAGKSTTYALKYALLYLFMVPTGTIADADNTKPQTQGKRKQTLTDAQFAKAQEAIGAGKYTEEALKADYALNQEQLQKLNK